MTSNTKISVGNIQGGICYPFYDFSATICYFLCKYVLVKVKKPAKQYT